MVTGVRGWLGDRGVGGWLGDGCGRMVGRWVWEDGWVTGEWENGWVAGVWEDGCAMGVIQAGMNASTTSGICIVAVAFLQDPGQ